VPVLVYLAAAVIYTWPLVLHPASHLAAPTGAGDPFLNLWILGWGMQTILGQPAALFTGRVFDANIFYPAHGTLTYSDHMLLQSALAAPVYAATDNLALAYNVIFFGSFVASGLAMHAFVRTVMGSTGGAYLAGLAWAFWSYRFAHLLHLQLQALYFLPLAFLFLHKVIAGRRTRDAVWLGVMAGLGALSSVYYAVIGALGLACGAIALTIGVGRWRSGLIARRLLLAAIVGAAIVAPIAWTYWQVQQEEGFGRNLFEASRGAASIASYVRVPPGNVVYGGTGLLAPAGPERELFPGLVIIGLALAGVVFGRRSDARPLVVSMLAVGALGFVLSLGPEGLRDLYAAFQRYVFGFAAIRAPARFAVLVMFALATLAALGWREVNARLKTRRHVPTSNAELPGRSLETGGLGVGRWRVSVVGPSRGSSDPLMIVLIGLAAIELLNVPIPLTAAPPRETAVGQWLRKEPGPGAVVHVPLALDIESTPAMVQSLEHRRPLVNGYSGQRPSFYSALVDTVKTFPSDASLLALHEFGVRFVVTASPVAAPSEDAPWPLLERARLADGVIYEFRWTPEIEERLARDVAVRPDPPGPIPFAAGETARYAVEWAGGAVDLSAGEITIAVQPPAFTFVVRAETAPWISRFFEARDVFTTRTDAELLPELHERDQREGARHVTRAYAYQHDEGVVRIGRTAEHAMSEEGVSLPLAPESRDAIAAVFYARTLPLEPGRRFMIPINEAGRQLVVELLVSRRERITVQDQPVDAIRLEPQMKRGAAARRTATATLWVSDDSRKVPVALDLEAGFGKVRLELVSYTGPS
jgi:hypothetical protein